VAKKEKLESVAQNWGTKFKNYRTRTNYIIYESNYVEKLWYNKLPN